MIHYVAFLNIINLKTVKEKTWVFFLVCLVPQQLWMHCRDTRSVFNWVTGDSMVCWLMTTILTSIRLWLGGVGRGLNWRIDFFNQLLVWEPLVTFLLIAYYHNACWRTSSELLSFCIQKRTSHKTLEGFCIYFPGVSLCS